MTSKSKLRGRPAVAVAVVGALLACAAVTHPAAQVPAGKANAGPKVDSSAPAPKGASPKKSEPAPAAAEPAPVPAATARDEKVAPQPAVVEPAKPPPPPASPEARYMAALDSAFEPLKELVVTPELAKGLQNAARAAASGDATGARTIRGQLTDPLARKIVDWLILRAGYGEPAEFKTFLETNPHWPDRSGLMRRAEEQLFAGGGSAERIRAYFASAEPRTAAGWAALASAHLAQGEEARAKAIASRAWREHELASTLETGFLERFKGLLTEADHRWRLDRLLVDDSRWKVERGERAAVARRLLPLLSEAERAKAEARIAVFMEAPAAAKLMAGLPAETEGSVDWGLAYQRVQLLRRGRQSAEVHKILLALPKDPQLIISPDDWWTERRNAAYEALRAGDAKLAYNLVRESEGLTVNPIKEASFLAGWIALRQLGDAKTAVAHFRAYRKAADGPLSHARAGYWLARALTALGETAEARTHLVFAEKYVDTFYGQLARVTLDPKATLTINPPAMPTEAEIKAFLANDAVRAAVMASNAGLSQAIVRAFLIQLRFALKSEGEQALLAHLAEALGDTQMAVRLAKAAVTADMNLYLYSYPTHPIPPFTPLRPPPEKAMLLGIARQESEFNATIVSGAGARGLLQVMPITAKHVCRDYKLRCDIPRLLTDNAYNATISAAYVGDRMREFTGSYVLTLSGYNAGPGRTRQWIGEFGDPRDPRVDVIDWIERVPIEETREYIKKVLSNIQVYRARLGEEGGLRLLVDLARGKSGTAPAN